VDSSCIPTIGTSRTDTWMSARTRIVDMVLATALSRYSSNQQVTIACPVQTESRHWNIGPSILTMVPPFLHIVQLRSDSSITGQASDDTLVPSRWNALGCQSGTTHRAMGSLLTRLELQLRCGQLVFSTQWRGCTNGAIHSTNQRLDVWVPLVLPHTAIATPFHQHNSSNSCRP